MSRESLAKYCLLLFLAINLPFWFLAVHVPLAAQRALGLALLGIAAITLRKVSLHPTIVLLWIFFLLLNVSKFFLGNLTLQNTLWFTGLPVVFALALLFAMSRDAIAEIFGSLCWLVIITTIPGVIVWFALIAGIDLPFTLISLGGRAALYRSYAGLAIVGDYSIFHFGGMTIARLCGMFEEPGLLGTILGVLLATDVVFFPGTRRVRKILMVTFGILTFSLAFLVMLFLVALHFVIASEARVGRTVLVMLPVTVLLFTSTVALNASQLLFLGRLQLNADSGNYETNRAVYGERFANEYLSTAGLTRVLLGNGPSSNAENEGGGFSSYLGVVYESGLLASLLLLLFVAYFALVPIFHWRSALAFLVLLGPFLSLYQRPDVQGVPYLIMFAMLFAFRDSPPSAARESLSLKPAVA